MDQLSGVIVSICTCSCLVLILIFSFIVFISLSMSVHFWPSGMLGHYLIRSLVKITCSCYQVSDDFFKMLDFMLTIPYSVSLSNTEWVKFLSEKHFHLMLTCLYLNSWIFLISININLSFLGTMFCDFCSFFNKFLQSFWPGLIFKIATNSLSVLRRAFEKFFLWSLKGSQQYNRSDSYLEIWAFSWWWHILSHIFNITCPFFQWINIFHVNDV